MQNGCLMLTWTFEWYFSHLKDVCETCIRSICTLSYRARSDWLSHRYSWQVHSLPRDRRPWSKRISMLLSLLPRMCGIYTIKSFAMFLYRSIIASIKLALSCISLGNSSVVGDMRIIILWLLLLTHEATDARQTDDASFNWFGFFVDEGLQLLLDVGILALSELMLVQDDGVSLCSSQAVIAPISTIAALRLAHWFATFNLLPQCLFLNLSIVDINSKLHRLLHRKLSLRVLVSANAAHPRLTWSYTGLTSSKVSLSCRLGMSMSL